MGRSALSFFRARPIRWGACRGRGGRRLVLGRRGLARLRPSPTPGKRFAPGWVGLPCFVGPPPPFFCGLGAAPAVWRPGPAPKRALQIAGRPRKLWARRAWRGLGGRPVEARACGPAGAAWFARASRFFGSAARRGARSARSAGAFVSGPNRAFAAPNLGELRHSRAESARFGPVSSARSGARQQSGRSDGARALLVPGGENP